MKKLTVILITLLMICQMVVFAASEDGISFGESDLYLTDDPLSSFPTTIEATLKFPKTFTGRGGVAIGNYTASGVPCFSFEVYTNGEPRFYHVGASNEKMNVMFSDVKLYKNEWIHLAIVSDKTNKEVLCYVNGVLAQKVTNVSFPTFADITSKVAVGGDLRSGNEQYFKGSIKNIRIYSDIRTADEIASDYNNSELDTNDLLLAYDMSTDSEGKRPKMLTDLSGNENHVYHNTYYWSNDVEPLKNYSHSMAVIGDTSFVIEAAPKEYNKMYDWLIKNADEKKIGFVFGLGDITAGDYAQYALADANFMNLNERIPFSFVRGDSDTVDKFNEIFTLERYSDEISSSYDSTMQNTYRKFEAGNLKYLALSLDVAASDDVINWANKVCTDNPDRNIIVSTHAYLDSDGNTLSNTLSLGVNVGTNLWNKLIKLHKNITIVLCGHADTENVVISKQKGVNNNEVTQILVNPKFVDSLASGSGEVAMLYFSEDGKDVQLRYYSPSKNAYFRDENQFSFSVNAIEEDSFQPETETVSLNLSADDVIKAENNVKYNYAFTLDTTNGVKLTGSTLSMDVELKEKTGEILAAVYNKYGRMTQVKVYNVEQNLTVDFDNISSGDKVKIMWWASIEGLNPISAPRWVQTYVVE